MSDIANIRFRTYIPRDPVLKKNNTNNVQQEDVRQELQKEGDFDDVLEEISKGNYVYSAEIKEKRALDPLRNILNSKL